MKIDEFISLALEEDLGDGDHSSLSTIPGDKTGAAQLLVKQDGILADLDWDKKPTEHGPPVDIRIDRSTAAGLIEKGGFRICSVSDSGDSHYLIRAQPGPVSR